MSKPLNVDVCVIGAGSGGLSVAAGAVQLGQKVVLIEAGEMGGDCLNTGCVPSKALLAAGKRAHEMRDAAKFGIAAVEPQIDFAAVNTHVKRVIAAIEPNDSQERFEKLGCTVIRAHARFTGPRTVEAGGQQVRARRIVIATGSSPLVPPITGLDTVDYLTNETVFEKTTRPEHLIVVGGGPIGAEMAQAHRRLGARVTLIEAARILPKDDPELVEVVRGALAREGVEILEEAPVAAVSKTADGVRVEVRRGEAQSHIDGSHVLLAVGRRANVDGLDLEKANVAYTAKGVSVKANLRSVTNRRVYAVGDVAGGRQFTHVAGYHAGIVVRNALFRAPAKNKEELAPWVSYCDPELAQAGLTEAEAREKHGDSIRVLCWPFADNDRAQAEHATEGLVKVVTEKNGRILGAGIAGRNAGELIGVWALALASGLKIGAFTSYIAPYPTLGEVSKRAAGAFYTPTLFSEKTRKLVRFLSFFG